MAYKSMVISNKRKPATHSDVLWHFTGGPIWDEVKQRQSSKLKTPETAYRNLTRILKEKVLRVGKYHELIKVQFDKIKKYDPEIKKTKTQKNIVETVETSPVCCVADIPLTELWHHAKRYGKMAIGWRRDSLVKAGFNPVLYTVHGQELIKNYYYSKNILESIGHSDITSKADSIVESIESRMSDLEGELSEHEDVDADIPDIGMEHGDEIRYEMKSLVEDIPQALNRLKNAMAFIKTFNNKEFDSIYAEREWRSISNFAFKDSDVAVILLPHEIAGSKRDYYNDFIRRDIKYAGLKKDKVIVWEDVVK